MYGCPPKKKQGTGRGRTVMYCEGFCTGTRGRGGATRTHLDVRVRVGLLRQPFVSLAQQTRRLCRACGGASSHRCRKQVRGGDGGYVGGQKWCQQQGARDCKQVQEARIRVHAPHRTRLFFPHGRVGPRTCGDVLVRIELHADLDRLLKEHLAALRPTAQVAQGPAGKETRARPDGSKSTQRRCNG